VHRFKRVIGLDELRAHARDALEGMIVLRAGNRLSVTPVDDAHWRFILSLE
jgi:predicted RNA-binding protein with PUA-like domain